MPKRSRPQKGSLQYWPRKRARRQYPSISNWPKISKKGLKGLAGYKVGMTHVMAIDNIPGSPTEGEEIQVPVTILEIPELRVVAIRFYGKKEGELQALGDVWDKNLPNKLSKTIPNGEGKFEDFEEELGEIEAIRAIVATQPWEIKSIPRKKPSLFEIELGGSNIEEKFGFAKEKLGEEISIKEAFDEGEQVDVIAVTKGKGFQGSVKRFGVKRLTHKAEKLRRKAGSMGAWHPHKTTFRTPQFGQMGYNTRTEQNKRIFKIGKADEINKEEGYDHYGVLTSNYILIKGSVPGPEKRLVLLRKAIRPKNIPREAPRITYIKK